MPIKLLDGPRKLALQKFDVRNREYDYYYGIYEKLSETDKKYARNLMKPFCEEFFETKEYKDGRKDICGYKACCEVLGFCDFWNQTWFYLVCSGSAVLLILLISGLLIIFILRKRKEESSSRYKGYVGKAERF